MFHKEISLRPGLPTLPDIIVSIVGIVLLVEAARRAVGPALAFIAGLMIDDPSTAIVKVPEFFETARTGLHLLLHGFVVVLQRQRRSPRVAIA